MYLSHNYGCQYIVSKCQTLSLAFSINYHDVIVTLALTAESYTQTQPIVFQLTFTQFDSQDVMVPWHLQPRYTTGHVGMNSDERAARVQAKKEKRKGKKRRQEALHQKRDSVGDNGESDCGLAEGRKEREGGRVFPRPEEEVGKCESGREPSSCGLEETCEPGTLQESSKSDIIGTVHSGVTYQRYYHVFREGELRELTCRVSTLRVQEEFYDHENWCVLATKVE